MADSRSYPDINFVETDTDTIKDSLIQAYELITGRTLYPADPIRIFILWVADIIAQERVLINESAKQNVPRYAEGEYLDSLAEIFKDVERLAPQAATTTLRFTISAAQASQIIVPLGTRATVDGEIIFATTEIGTITAGNTYVDVSATCQTVGTAGNGFTPGQIATAIDVFPYMQSVSNTTTSEGGSEEETDEAFYERMRESVESYSTAGPSGAYEYIAKTVNALISDVKATSTTAGIVDVYILLQNGQLPGPEILAQVLEALSASKARPLTDTVNVNAPETMTFNIDFTYFIPLVSAASTAVIQQAVTDAVTAYKKWQTSKMGRDINPSYLISLLMQTGIKRVELTAPVHTVVPDGKVAVFGSQNIVNGGFEDE
jgi:phage-related baseplate assembly protein